MREREIANWNTVLKPTEGKRIVVYTTLRKKIKDNFSFTQDTRKIQERLKQKKKRHKKDKFMVFSRTIIWVLQSHRVEIFKRIPI